MILNNTAYAHKQIRLLLYQLEILSGMQLITNVEEEFEQIRLIDKYGYIIINYKKNACFTLSHTMSPDEWKTVQDIMLYLSWLEIGLKYEKERIKSNKKEMLKRRKTTRKK